MPSFSTWAHRLKTHLHSAGVLIPLGHAQELLASGLGHNTLASFLVSEVDALKRADHVVLREDAMQKRAAALNIDLSPVTRLSEILDILDDPNGEPDFDGLSIRSPNLSGPICDRSFQDRVPLIVEQFELTLPKFWAEKFGGVQGKTVVAEVHDSGPFPESEGERCWYWTFAGWTRVRNQSSGLQMPVHGVLVFPRIGRTLFGAAELSRLDRTGDPQPFDDDMDQGDVYWNDSSD